MNRKSQPDGRGCELFRAVAAAMLASGILLLAPAPLSAQRDFSKVEIKSTTVGEGIYMLTGAGGNLVVSSGKNGIFLVDDQFAPLTEKIKNAISVITGSAAPIRFVLNTHWHGDHTGGNENMGNSGSVIVAHENVRRRMSTEQVNEFFKDTTKPSPEAALPIITFTDDVTFHLNGDEIHVFHADSAHTDGDAVVHFLHSNIIHTGDLFFSGMYPYIDLASGGSLPGLIAATDNIIALTNDSSKIIPGHGPLSTLADLKSYRAMLIDIRERVQRFITEGKTIKEVIAAKPTSTYDDQWGKGFMKPDIFTEIVYTSLTR